jgi:ribosomal protein S18 acetylase RimI-like enzyme
MNIYNIVNIYIILLIVLAVHYFLISKKITVWELWILMPIFLFVDYLNFALTGCGFSNQFDCNPRTQFDFFLYFVYSILLIIIIGYYSYKIYLFKYLDILKIANISLILISSFLIQDLFYVHEDISMTLAIVIPFLIVIDFIIGIVNKTYSHKMLLYYIRTSTLWFVFFFMAVELEFFKGGADNRTLIIMVVISYISLGIVILKPLLKINIDAKPILQNKNIKLVKCTEELLKQVRNEYSDKHADKITLDDKTYTLVALDKNLVIGLISTTLIELEPPLDKVVEAHINIITLKEEYYQYGVAERLIKKTEAYFKNTEATQIYGWSTNTLIQLWNNLGYTFTLYTKLDDKTKPNTQEYGILKKL